MNKIKTILGASILLLVSVQVSASLITFESLRVDSDQQTFIHGTSYTEDGFSLSATCCEPVAGPQVTDLRTGGTLAPEFAGSTAMRGGKSNTLITLTANDGGLFNLLSIDLAAFPGTQVVNGVLVPIDTGTPQVVTFVGIKFGGDTVTQTITHTDFLNLTTYSFIGFHQLSSVSWFQGAGDPFTHQFDNVSVVPVPLLVTFRTVAMSGDIAPGTVGEAFSFFSVPALNDNGDVAFLGLLPLTAENPGTNEGIWKEDPSLGLVVRTGDNAPGIAGETYSGFAGSKLQLNNSGHTAFPAGSSGGGSGIWKEDPTLGLVVRNGDTAPETGGASFLSFAFSALNDNGDTAFAADLVGIGVNSDNNEGIWKEDPTLGIVVRASDVAPGTGGETFQTFAGGAPEFNDNGHIAFSASVSSSGGNRHTLWKEGPSLELVVREGDVAPGTGGATFQSFSGRAFNDSDNMAFVGLLTGTGVNGSNDIGIWKEGPSLELVVREGDVAPGTGGATFLSLGLARPAFNDNGDIAFLAFITGAGVSSNDIGLWIKASGLELVIQEGDLLEVGTGDIRVVFELSVLDDGGAFINNARDVAFRAAFTDGTVGIFVASLFQPTLVTIDIKPGSDPNSINLKSKGVIPVAILSTNTAVGEALDFDATQVDFSTVTFGPNGAVESHGQGHVEDVDGDGDPDMVFHFNTQETGIVCDDADATLDGETFENIQFTGTDTVKTVGCNDSKQDTSISTKGAGAMSWIFLVGLSVLGLWRQKG